MGHILEAAGTSFDKGSSLEWPLSLMWEIRAEYDFWLSHISKPAASFSTNFSIVCENRFRLRWLKVKFLRCICNFCPPVMLPPPMFQLALQSMAFSAKAFLQTTLDWMKIEFFAVFPNIWFRSFLGPYLAPKNWFWGAEKTFLLMGLFPNLSSRYDHISWLLWLESQRASDSPHS